MQQAVQKSSPAVTFEDIRTLVRQDLPALPAAPEKPMLGDFEKTYQWLAQAQHKDKPALHHPRLCLFAVGTPPQATLDILAPLAAQANADLKVYELGLERPEEALTEHETAHAVAYGMMAVQPGVDLVAVAAGADYPGLENPGQDPLLALQNEGGLDAAALLGCMIAARLARIPVLLEGQAAAAVAGLLTALHPDAAAHCRATESILAEKTALPPPARGLLLMPLLAELAQV